MCGMLHAMLAPGDDARQRWTSHAASIRGTQTKASGRARSALQAAMADSTVTWHTAGAGLGDHTPKLRSGIVNSSRAVSIPHVMLPLRASTAPSAKPQGVLATAHTCHESTARGRQGHWGA